MSTLIIDQSIRHFGTRLHFVRHNGLDSHTMIASFPGSGAREPGNEVNTMTASLDIYCARAEEVGHGNG